MTETCYFSFENNKRFDPDIHFHPLKVQIEAQIRTHSKIQHRGQEPSCHSEVGNAGRLDRIIDYHELSGLGLNQFFIHPLIFIEHPTVCQALVLRTQR